MFPVPPPRYIGEVLVGDRPVPVRDLALPSPLYRFPLSLSPDPTVLSRRVHPRRHGQTELPHGPEPGSVSFSSSFSTSKVDPRVSFRLYTVRGSSLDSPSSSRHTDLFPSRVRVLPNLHFTTPTQPVVRVLGDWRVGSRSHTLSVLHPSTRNVSRDPISCDPLNSCVSTSEPLNERNSAYRLPQTLHERCRRCSGNFFENCPSFLSPCPTVSRGSE